MCDPAAIKPLTSASQAAAVLPTRLEATLRGQHAAYISASLNTNLPKESITLKK
jgi:hypothetical protein